LEGTGFALARWVSENRTDVEVLISGTIEGAANVASELCNGGASHRKPIDHAELLARIRRLLRARGPSRSVRPSAAH